VDRFEVEFAGPDAVWLSFLGGGMSTKKCVFSVPQNATRPSNVTLLSR